MSALQSIGRRELTRRKVRYALTAFGILLGVANIFGVLVTNATTNRSVAERAENFAGGADVMASRSDPSIPFVSRDLARFRQLPRVRQTAIFWQGFDVDSTPSKKRFFTLGGA